MKLSPLGAELVRSDWGQYTMSRRSDHRIQPVLISPDVAEVVPADH